MGGCSIGESSANRRVQKYYVCNLQKYGDSNLLMKLTRFVQKKLYQYLEWLNVYLHRCVDNGRSLDTCVHEYGFRRNDGVLPLKAVRLKLNGPSRIYKNIKFSRPVLLW